MILRKPHSALLAGLAHRALQPMVFAVRLLGVALWYIALWAAMRLGGARV